MLHSVSYFPRMKHHALIISDICRESRIYPYPFTQRLAPCHAYHMAVNVRVPCLGQTGDVPCRNTLREQSFGKTDGQCAAIVATGVASGTVICIAQIACSGANPLLPSCVMLLCTQYSRFLIRLISSPWPAMLSRLKRSRDSVSRLSVGLAYLKRSIMHPLPNTSGEYSSGIVI